ncbi:PAS domain S-box protein [candidate division KSB1 bacterium]|nr:PAS domain S-box protein [candidate division KSB1 bacterium]
MKRIPGTEFETCVKLEEIIEFSDFGMLILDDELKILFWSERLEQLYGITESEILGKNVLDVFPILKKEGLIAPLKKVMKGESSNIFSFQHQTLYKGIRYIDFRGYPRKNDKSEITGIIVLLRDVTDKVSSQFALKKYEKYMANIFQDAADAIIILDENNKIVMWNRGAEEVYGYCAAEVIGLNIKLIVPDDPESQKEIEWISEEVKRKGYLRNWQARRLTRDGRKITISLTRTAIYNEKNEYIGSSVITRDITEKINLENQILQSEKLAAVGKLAAGIAHDVGNPLNSIISITQLLYDKSDVFWQRQKLKLIYEQVERINRTVGQLVDFSRPANFVVTKQKINSIILDAVRIVKYDHRLRYIPIETKLQKNLPELMLSYDQFLQVLINLFLNSGDALENKENPKIEVISSRIEDKIEIQIRDNGCGIPSENIKQLFTPFFSTKSPGKGTGLGLWISYQMIKQFSGEISVQSIPGTETIFCITFPINQGEKRS